MTETGTSLISELRQREEETALSLLKTATLCSSNEELARRQAYLKRLRTFRPTTYFAKPESLSPIVCSRFGWTNASVDMLVCETCNAALAISFHPHLKSADVKRIANVYQSKLCSGHKMTCAFYSSSFPKSGSVEVPSYLASVLPQETVDLVEQPAPQQSLKRLVARLVETAGSRKIVPLELRQKDMKGCLDDGETPESFVSRIAAALDAPKENEWAVELALFGWEMVSDSDQELLSVHCNTCLAHGKLPVQSNDIEEAPPAKKRRAEPFNPIASHKYYCPFVCGFPSEGSHVPMWQTIVTHLTTSNETPAVVNGEEILMKVHRILKSGLSSS